MTKTTKILLGLSVVGIGSGLVFVSGLINVQANVAYYVSLPAGAILFGLFLISVLLEKETALFDAEHLAYSQPAKKCAQGNCGCAGGKQPVLAGSR
jgi:hypothetical protein